MATAARTTMPRRSQPIAPEGEWTRHETVLGQDCGEAREGVEAGVARQEEDQRGTDLEQTNGTVPSPKTAAPTWP